MALSQLEVDKQQLNSTERGASTVVPGPVDGK